MRESSLTPVARDLLKQMEPYVEVDPGRFYTIEDVSFIIGRREARMIGLILKPLERLGYVTRFMPHGDTALYQFNAEAFARFRESDKLWKQYYQQKTLDVVQQEIARNQVGEHKAA